MRLKKKQGGNNFFIFFISHFSTGDGLNKKEEGNFHFSFLNWRWFEEKTRRQFSFFISELEMV
jgi:hypothetical protein